MSADPPSPLRVLVLEDADDDAELMARELRRAGLDAECMRVADEASYRARLAPGVDLILADHDLRGFDALRALALLRARGLDVPFIIVSRTVREAAAVEALRHGATDYVLKDRLGCLGPAAARALAHSRLRREHAHLARIVATSRDAIVSATLEGTILGWNHGAERLFGYPAAEAIGRPVSLIVPHERRAELASVLATLARGLPTPALDTAARRRDGTLVDVSLSLVAVREPCGGIAAFSAIARDVGTYRRIERALAESARVSTSLARAARELLAILDPQLMLRRICALAAELLGRDECGAWTWRPAPEDYRLACYAPAALDGGRGAPGGTLSNASALVRVLAQADLLDVPVGELPDAGVRALLRSRRLARATCLTLRRGTRVDAVVIAGHHDAGAALDAAVTRIAHGLASVASLAFTNAQLVEELRVANRLKSEFVSTMSHELRTPLNVIFGFLELARDHRGADREHAAFIDGIDEASRYLLELIENTLDAAKLEAGVDDVILEAYALPALAESWRHDCALLARAAAVTLEWAPVPAVELRTDKRRLRAIIRNLVANALKFTERGRVGVRMRASGDALVVDVDDTGIGIRREDHELIFERFRQIDGSDTRRHGGTGLGLYIVRQFTHQLGGTVHVASELGAGAMFTVTLRGAVGQRARESTATRLAE